jgi:DNA modification methylase
MENGPTQSPAAARIRVEYVRPEELKPAARNARVHSKRQIHQIASSIAEFGFTCPVLVDGTNVVIAGHARLEAAKLLALSQIPTIRIDHLTSIQKIAYGIADNKLALNSQWDFEVLALELREIEAIDPEFELELTGFETTELDILIDGAAGPTADDPADIELQPSTSVTVNGELWQLGNHRLLCGDARNADSYTRLMSNEKARVVVTDPPYNVRINGHAGGLGNVKHREFSMASGEMTDAEFKTFLRGPLQHALQSSMDGAIHFIFMDWRHIGQLLEVGNEIYSELKNICVWNKTNGGMGSFYRSKHELVCVFKVGDGPHINTIELGRNGRYRTNVWDYPGVNTMRNGRMEDLLMHPTVKPVALLVDALKDCSRRGDMVLDPFGGSGTTLIAAEKSGRIARLIELDPCYVDVTIRRWQKLSGKKAVQTTTNRSFDDLSVERITVDKCK